MGIPDFESSAFGHSANFPKNYGWKLFLLIKTEPSPALCEILSTTSLRDLSTTILRVLSTSSKDQSTWMRDHSTLLKEKPNPFEGEVTPLIDNACGSIRVKLLDFAPTNYLFLMQR